MIKRKSAICSNSFQGIGLPVFSVEILINLPNIAGIISSVNESINKPAELIVNSLKNQIN